MGEDAITGEGDTYAEMVGLGEDVVKLGEGVKGALSRGVRVEPSLAWGENEAEGERESVEVGVWEGDTLGEEDEEGGEEEVRVNKGGVPVMEEVGEISDVKVAFRATEGDIAGEKEMNDVCVTVGECVPLLLPEIVPCMEPVADTKGEKVVELETEEVPTAETVFPVFREREGGLVGNEVPLAPTLPLPVTVGDGTMGVLDTCLLNEGLGEAEGSMGVDEGEPPEVGETRLDLDTDWVGDKSPEGDREAVADTKLEGDFVMEGDIVVVNGGVGDRVTPDVREAKRVPTEVIVGIVREAKEEGDTVESNVALGVKDDPPPPPAVPVGE